MKNTPKQRDNLTPVESEQVRANDAENETAILGDGAARITVCLRDSGEEEEDSDGKQPESNTESDSNANRPGKKKKKDSRTHNNKVTKTLGYKSWMRNNMWKNGAKRLTGDDVKKTQEDAQKRLRRKRDLKRSTETLLLAQN